MIQCCAHNQIKLTKQRNTELAAVELRRKIQMEAAFKRELRTLFNGVRTDYRAVVATTNAPPDAARYRTAFQGVFEGHNIRVQRNFRREVFDQNGKSLWFYSQKRTEEETNEIIAIALIELGRQLAERDAELVTQTTALQMQEALFRAREQMVVQGEALDSRTVAAMAAAFLGLQFNKRVPLIAQTQTQQAAEGTKQVVAQAISGRVPFSITGRALQPATSTDQLDITCTWDTVGDRLVRDGHRAANGTKIGIDEVFNVNGERLRFPGDGGLGASASNLINCRCSKRFEVV